MPASPYFMPRPPLANDPVARAAFDALFDEAAHRGGNAPIAYELPWPRWQFICHIADTRPIVVHGSQNAEIDEFEPRQSNDVHPFGDRKAVYATSDGLWSMFYAVLDRASTPMFIVNAALRLETNGGLGAPIYYFSVSRAALEARAYATGVVYFLPRDTFELMPPQDVRGGRAHIPQWASLESVRPIARITVSPDDFPFLERIRGHDDEAVLARAKADPDGFPWLD